MVCFITSNEKLNTIRSVRILIYIVSKKNDLRLCHVASIIAWASVDIIYSFSLRLRKKILF